METIFQSSGIINVLAGQDKYYSAKAKNILVPTQMKNVFMNVKMCISTDRL